MGSVDMFAETPVRVVDRVVEEVEEVGVVGVVVDGVEEEERSEAGAGTEEEELAIVEEVRGVEETINRSNTEEQVEQEEEQVEKEVEEQVEEQVEEDLPNTEDFLGGLSEGATSTQEIQEVSWTTCTRHLDMLPILSLKH